MSNKLWDAKASDVSPEEYAAIEAEERLVYETQKAVRNLLKHNGMKALDLARLLRVSEARVSQMLGGEAKNLTLRTLARIFHALGSRCVVVREELQIAKTPSQAGPIIAKAEAPISGRVTGRADARPKQSTAPADDDFALWSRLTEPHLLAELTDGAAYGKQAVWVFGSGILPANENERPRNPCPRNEDVARSWMAAPLPHENSREKAYA